MHYGNPRREKLRLVIAAAMGCAVGLLVAGSAAGEDAAAAVTPEIVAKVSEFFKQVDAARRPKKDESMAAEIRDIAATTGLDSEGVKILQAAAGPAEDAAQAEQLANQIKVKPAEYAKLGESALRSIDEPGAVQTMAEAPETIPYTGPTEQPAWKDALARVFTPEQAATWEKTQAGRLVEARKEIETFLDAQIGQYRSGREEGMLARSHAIIAALNLPKERADAVNALAIKAVDASMDRWREGATKSLLKPSAAQRNAILKSKSFSFAFEAEDAPEKLAVWTDGIATLLTDDDRARLQSLEEARRTRRVHVLGQLLVALIDEKAAFTTSQRPQLERLAEPLVEKRRPFFPAPGEETSYDTFSPPNFYQTAAGVDPALLRQILDDLQIKHWQALKDEKTGGSYEEAVPTPAPPGGDAKGPGEPEDMEQTVADFLQARTAEHRREIENIKTLSAEDATRVAALAPPNAARLQTAARGAAEAATEPWVMNIEQTVRMSVQGATRENLAQRLGSISTYYFRQRIVPPEDGLWKATVDAELTGPQQAAWQAERDARTEYREAAVAQFATMGFDQQVGLSAEQWQTVLPLITKASHDYRPDIENMFSYNNSVPWYLSSYYALLPLHGVPEAEFKKVLTKEQWDRWTGSSEFSNTASYWDNIRESHDTRVKNTEEQTKEKEKKKP